MKLSKLERIVEQQLAAVQLADDYEAELGNLIQELQKAGHGREAAAMGEIIGNYRRGRVGDMMLKHAVERAKSLLGK